MFTIVDFPLLSLNLIANLFRTRMGKIGQVDRDTTLPIRSLPLKEVMESRSQTGHRIHAQGEDEGDGLSGWC